MSARPTRRQRGIALPIALIVMFALTGLVLMQMRRGMTDERLAANSRETTLLASAAETVLRGCEERLRAEFVLDSSQLPTIIARITPAPGVTEWRRAANWQVPRMHQNPDAVMPPEIVWHACLVEDASAEVVRSSGVSADGSVGDSGISRFRITAQVRIAEPGASATPGSDATPLVPAGARGYFAQSELTFFQ